MAFVYKAERKIILAVNEVSEDVRNMNIGPCAYQQFE